MRPQPEAGGVPKRPKYLYAMLASHREAARNKWNGMVVGMVTLIV